MRAESIHRQIVTLFCFLPAIITQPATLPDILKPDATSTKVFLPAPVYPFTSCWFILYSFCSATSTLATSVNCPPLFSSQMGVFLLETRSDYPYFICADPDSKIFLSWWQHLACCQELKCWTSFAWNTADSSHECKEAWPTESMPPTCSTLSGFKAKAVSIKTKLCRLEPLWATALYWGWQWTWVSKHRWHVDRRCKP